MLKRLVIWYLARRHHRRYGCDYQHLIGIDGHTRKCMVCRRVFVWVDGLGDWAPTSRFEVD